MRIAFLMQESEMAGIEYNSLALAERIDRSKFAITFLCPCEGKLTEKCRRAHLPYFIIPRPRFFSTSIQFGEKSILLNPFAIVYNFFAVIFSAMRYRRFLRKEKFDIVCTKGLMANFYGSLALMGITGTCIWDMQEIIDRRRAFGLILWCVNMWAYFLADRVIVGSAALREQFYRFLWKKISVIYNGVSLDIFNPEKIDCRTVRGELNIAEKQAVVAHIARFTYWKGQLDFIRAAKIVHDNHPGVKFLLVGDTLFETSRYKKMIIAEIKKLHLESDIVLLGFREDLPYVLAAIDIFVHSSIEPEGCPLTLIYAMAMKKAIVATNVAGTNELISEESGILVPPGSTPKIAAAIEKFIDDDDIRKRMGYNAQRRATEMFSLEKYAAESEKVFLNSQNA
ncbi:MAG: glycosyltransferase [Candidatus Omnitrophica bacterium]|nr:glycosyltransferase [Candidatus Omnitrophota bacterium]